MVYNYKSDRNRLCRRRMVLSEREAVYKQAAFSDEPEKMACITVMQACIPLVFGERLRTPGGVAKGQMFKVIPLSPSAPTPPARHLL
jgi:hypothetical protein